MKRDDLERLYDMLCARLTEAGEENMSAVLARLSMLLLQSADDVESAAAAIERAAEGFGPAAANANNAGISQ